MLDFLTLSTPRYEKSDDETFLHSMPFAPQAGAPGVNGGYIAAGMLRAAGEASGKDRPVSISVQYGRVVITGSSDIRSNVLSRGRSADLVQTEIHQFRRTCVTAHVWSTRKAVAFDPACSQMPEVPAPDGLAKAQLDPEEAHGFWRAFDQRPVPVTPGTPARARRWVRFPGANPQGSSYAWAAMTMPIIDLLGVTAAENGFPGEKALQSLATTHLTAQFYDIDEADDWLLGDASVEHMSDRMLSVRVLVWSTRRRLLAQGLTQYAFQHGKNLSVAIP